MRMLELPKVKVYKYQRVKGEYRCEKIPDGVAVFHRWGVDYDEFETGPGNFSTAIIEREDGTIEMPRADMVQFIDE